MSESDANEVPLCPKRIGETGEKGQSLFVGFTYPRGFVLMGGAMGRQVQSLLAVATASILAKVSMNGEALLQFAPMECWKRRKTEAGEGGEKGKSTPASGVENSVGEGGGG